MQATSERDDVIEIDLQELAGALLQWSWLIIGCGILTAVVGFVLSCFIITPKYESVTKVYILNTNEGGALTYSDVQLGTQLTKDYAQLIKGRYVLEKVIETCSLEDSYKELESKVTVETLTDTRIIAITVEDDNPKRAQLIANEIRKVAAEQITSVMDIQAVNVVEEANLPATPSSPNILKWTALGALFGVFVCSVIIVIRFLADDSIKTSEDVEKYLQLSTLALIPVIETDTDKNTRKKRRKAKNSESAKEPQTQELEEIQ